MALLSLPVTSPKGERLLAAKVCLLKEFGADEIADNVGVRDSLDGLLENLVVGVRVSAATLLLLASLSLLARAGPLLSRLLGLSLLLLAAAATLSTLASLALGATLRTLTTASLLAVASSTGGRCVSIMGALGLRERIIMSQRSVLMTMHRLVHRLMRRLVHRLMNRLMHRLMHRLMNRLMSGLHRLWLLRLLIKRLWLDVRRRARVSGRMSTLAALLCWVSASLATATTSASTLSLTTRSPHGVGSVIVGFLL